MFGLGGVTRQVEEGGNVSENARLTPNFFSKTLSPNFFIFSGLGVQLRNDSNLTWS